MAAQVVLGPDDFALNENSLVGRSALVTGASAGIGLATACQLAAHGCHLFLLSRRKELLDSIRNQILERFPRLIIVVCASDVRDPSLIGQLADVGALDADILINNAGLALGREFATDVNMEDVQVVIDTNVMAPVRLVRAMLPRMLARNRPAHIINIGSIAGNQTYEGGSIYCASKHALRAFTETLRLETYGSQVRVSLLSPGMVETDFSKVRFRGDVDKARAVYHGMTPMTGQDMARIIVKILREPQHVNIDNVTVLPTDQGSATRIARRS